MGDDFGVILEGFIEEIHSDFGLRIDMENIFWRGFYSQGDGLCFDFELEDKEAVDFLIKLDLKNMDYFKEAIDNSFIRMEVVTVRNNFATHYCHSNTRDIDITIYFERDAEIKNKQLFDLVSDSKSLKNLQTEIKSWYVNICDEMYNELEKHYNVIQELEEQENSSLIGDSEIDPDMNIDKVINLLQDATSLNYTKGESYNIIEKFRESFKNNYVIVKKL